MTLPSSAQIFPESHGAPPSLEPALCRTRQQRLCRYLEEKQQEGIVFFDRHYVYALTGYWHHQPLTPTALWMSADGVATLFTHEESPEAPAADTVVAYIPNNLFTLRENLPSCITEVMNPLLKGVAGTVGVCHQTPTALLSGPAFTDITIDYQHLRRIKDPDEVEALVFTIHCADLAYAKAKEMIAPGISEVQVMAAMREVATNAAGELLSGWGQDFQCGAPGGFARRRAIEAGEIFVLDVGVGVRGYRSDLCRSFAVGGEPSEAQMVAFEKIQEVIELGEKYLKSGQSCAEMHDLIHQELDGWNGYAFFHHSGHGIGLDAHEVPRINPHWDDTFAIGDVIAFEPGLYGSALQGGIRIENNYLITESGFEKLSHFPTSLV